MVRDDEKYIFADCAINIAPTSEDLAEIAVESAKTAKLFDVDPKVAMLSFSTKGSAKSEETEKVIEAISIAKEKDETLRSEEHTSELQSRFDLVCRLLLEKKKII